MKNITFRKLSIANFLSIGKELVIPLDKGGITVITGYNFDKEDGNGVGKSAIVDAFFFALFGDTLKNLKKEEIVNDIAKKGCEVKLEFEINQNGTVTPYRIERGLVPSYCKVFVDNAKEEDKTLSTIPVTNNYIINLINSTPTVFRNTITMCLNNTVPFMAQKKNEKRAFIEGILRLELFKIMNKVAKENHSTILKEYNFTLKNHEEIVRNITTFSDRKEGFEKNRIEKTDTLNQRKQQYLDDIKNVEGRKVKVDENEYQKLVAKREAINKEFDENSKANSLLNSSVSSLETKKKMNASSISTIETKVTVLKKEYEKYPKYDTGIKTIDEFTAFIEETKSQVEIDKKSEVEANRDIRDEEAKIKTIESTGAFCEACKRPYPENDVKKNEAYITLCKKNIDGKITTIAKAKEQIKKNEQGIAKAELILQMLDLNKQKKNLAAENESLESSLVSNTQQLKDTQKVTEDLKTKKQETQTKADEVRAKINENKSIDDLVKAHQKNLKFCEDDIASLSTEKNEFIDLIATTEAKKTELEKIIEDSKEMIAIYDVIKLVVSDEGVKAFIIKKLLGVLNERVAYYLIEMDANCTMVFDEYFDVILVNDKKNECSYDNFSNGEQKRVDLACLYAFKDLRRIQGDINFNLSFYDELLDSALSLNGSQKVFDILKDRADNYNEAAFVVTHKKENLKNPLITDIIYLEKSGGITRIGEQ